jgi:hypothetical protein
MKILHGERIFAAMFLMSLSAADPVLKSRRSGERRRKEDGTLVKSI